MRRFLALCLTLALAFSLAACGDRRAAQSDPTPNNSPAASGSEPPQPTRTPPADAVLPEETAESKILVAYFSLAGEQYEVGVIEEGNTVILAKMIAEQTGGDLFSIDAVTPYPTSHSELLDVSRQEMASDTRPEIAETVEHWEDYDTVFLGYPNWWGDMPMIVYGFLESYDFSGKTIVPFCTHGGSGLSSTEGTIADLCPGAELLPGLSVRGSTAQNDRDAARSAVTDWLKDGGFVD